MRGMREFVGDEAERLEAASCSHHVQRRKEPLAVSAQARYRFPLL